MKLDELAYIFKDFEITSERTYNLHLTTRYLNSSYCVREQEIEKDLHNAILETIKKEKSE